MRKRHCAAFGGAGHNARDRERIGRERADFEGRQRETEEKIAAAERTYQERLAAEEDERRLASEIEAARGALRQESESLAAKRLALEQRDNALRTRAGEAMQQVSAAQASADELRRQLGVLSGDEPERTAALLKARAALSEGEARLAEKAEQIPALENVVIGFRLKKRIASAPRRAAYRAHPVRDDRACGRAQPREDAAGA